MRIIILGPPGAGKGTQAKRVSNRLGLPHFSTGSLLRKAVSNNTLLGKIAKSYMSEGELVPNPIIIDLIEEEIEKHKDKEGFILDGFPRNVAQAQKLDEYLEHGGKQLDIIVNLEIDEETIIERIKGRLSCPKCGKVYNTKNGYYERVCENCGTKLEQREDDSEETVRNRMKVYLEETFILVDYYQKKGILQSISGRGSPDEVFERILALID